MSPSIARRAFALVFSLVLANAGAARAAEILTVDRLVAHTSTVPAIRGEKVGLFVRERVASGMLDGAGSLEGKVVLMVHGGFSPATLAFDVAYRDYSWMEHLAREGFDVFAMDMTGYGRSTRPPQMDDPCNLVPVQQKEIAPRPLATPCKASYPHELVNSDSETDDINAVVDFIRKLRGVDKIALVGWSGGGIRTGTFVTRHPEKVDRYVIWASSNYSRANPSQAPELPAAGAPTTFQTRRVGVDQRWLGTSKCDGVIEPGLPEMISALNQQADPLGASWGPGGLRAPTRTYWGWNAEGAKKVVAPTLVMVGEQDGLMKSNQELYEDLGAQQKVYLSIACGTHFMNWEAQRRVLHKASADWLKTGTLGGAKTGAFRADEKGAITERRP